MANAPAELVREMFAAYSSRDRKAAEALLSDDLTFTSPYDNHLDKSAYFARCWPLPDNFKAIDIEKIAVEGNQVFVRYRIQQRDGVEFRNTELHRVEGNRIRSIEVYFGSLPSVEAIADSGGSGGGTPRPLGSNDQARLQIFAGTWRFEGRAHASPFGPASLISGVESFEWLSGKNFMIHRLDGRAGDAPIACIEIIGPDRPSKGESKTHTGFIARTFYDTGATNVWSMNEQDGTWRLAGTWMDGEDPVKVRCTINFHERGTRRTAKWEYSSDGDRWQTFWDTSATKAHELT